MGSGGESGGGSGGTASAGSPTTTGGTGVTWTLGAIVGRGVLEDEEIRRSSRAHGGVF